MNTQKEFKKALAMTATVSLGGKQYVEWTFGGPEFRVIWSHEYKVATGTVFASERFESIWFQDGDTEKFTRATSLWHLFCLIGI